MLTAIAAYLAAHFAVYVLVVRHMPSLHSERGIFLYHVASALFVGLAGLSLAIIDPLGFGAPGLVFVLSIHGIYSLSFLELWSLAEGGYSLYILASIARAQAAGGEPDFADQEQLGEAKQRARLDGLKKLGLIAIRNGAVGLTARGRGAAAIVLFFTRWINPRRAMRIR
jgi:hypothetical protein